MLVAFARLRQSLAADEAKTNLRVAVAWGYLTRVETAEVLDDLDHLLAMLWKMTH